MWHDVMLSLIAGGGFGVMTVMVMTKLRGKV
jgi:hypothetical protein